MVQKFIIIAHMLGRLHGLQQNLIYVSVMPLASVFKSLCVTCYTCAMQASEASGLPTGSRAWGEVDLNSEE